MLYTLYCMLWMVICVKGQFGDPFVDTQYGTLRGNTFDNGFPTKTVTQFLAIPYAQPPIGQLRFKKPQPVQSWTGIRNATQVGNSCFNLNNDGATRIYSYVDLSISWMQSEDCLTLDVYYPGAFSNRDNNTAPKQVMVFIHGGGYVLGSSNQYDSSILSGVEDVIVVVMNYRLGLFGFASTEQIPANLGMFDQLAALKWVQENIRVFGGDPGQVTIFGVSAGGDSVECHLVSPLSRGLFKRAIIQSSPSYSHLTSTQQQAIVLSLARSNWNCSASDLFQCLAGLPAYKLNMIAMDSTLQLYTGNPAPVIDGEFLTGEPIDLLREGNFDPSVDVIVGYTGDDGDFLINGFNAIFGSYHDFVANGTNIEAVQSFLQIMVPFTYPASVDNQIVLDTIYYHIDEEYLNDKKSALELARGVLDIATDISFLSHAFNIAHQIAKSGGNVYVYEFDYRSVNGLVLDPTLQPNIKLSAGHGAELLFMLGYGLYSQGLQDKIMSKTIMQSWSSFAKHGRPMYLTNSNLAVSWTPYTLDNKNFLLMADPMSISSVQPVPEKLITRANLWHTTIPEIIRSPPMCVPSDCVEPPVSMAPGSVVSHIWMVLVTILTIIVAIF